MLPAETLPTMLSVRGVRYDQEKKRIVFPLREHDNLQVAFAAIRVTVEPLPRAVIAAAQLSHKRDNPSRIVDVDRIDDDVNIISMAIEEKAAETLKILQGKIKERMLSSLAPFQKEGVLFVINNNGRAIIADEMGLGDKLLISLH